MAYLSYAICELSMVNLSGIVAIFVFGIVQSHYNRFNISKDALDKTDTILEILSYISES